MEIEKQHCNSPPSPIFFYHRQRRGLSAKQTEIEITFTKPLLKDQHHNTLVLYPKVKYRHLCNNIQSIVKYSYIINIYYIS